MAEEPAAATEKNEIITEEMAEVSKGVKFYWRHREEILQKLKDKKMADPEYKKMYEERQKKREEKERKKIELEKKREARIKIAEESRLKKT